MDLNPALSGWLSASYSDDRFASVHDFSDLEAVNAAEFLTLESSVKSLFHLRSPGLDDDREENLDIV
jgi:hypothetical protein